MKTVIYSVNQYRERKKFAWLPIILKDCYKNKYKVWLEFYGVLEKSVEATDSELTGKTYIKWEVVDKYPLFYV